MRSFLKDLLPSSVQSNVEFCGHLASPQLKQVLRSTTVCVFPSRYEGLPMVCLEAMASGKAIVATDLPGFRELIADGESGLIVKQEDPGALAAGLERLLSDKALLARLGSNARDVARSRLHGTVVAESMLRIYRAATDFQTSQAELVTTRAKP